MRVLGLDVGSKTIGVAVSDEMGYAAHPRQVLARKGTGLDVDAVVKLVEAEEAKRVVIGLPLELSGQLGHRGKRVMIFVDALTARLGETIPVETWDERFSTVGAGRALMDADLSRARRKEVIDKQAAAFILQGWLDAQRTSG
jgi:putative holliday junction resolvase